MGIGYLILLLFIGYVALKYYTVKLAIEKKVSNQLVAPPGVNYYCSAPATSRPQQVWAFGESNCCSVTQQGFSPAFGPQENQPEGIRLEI